MIVRGPLRACTIKRPTELVEIEIGEYEIERIENPFGIDLPWILFKGRGIGGSLPYFEKQESCTIIEEGE